MQNKASPTLIGLFVLSAILLAIGAIFYLGGDGLSDKSQGFILYFDGDVKGLQIGAPVTLRGVKVGQVEEMSIFFHEEVQSFEIPVIAKIDLSNLGLNDHPEPVAGRRLLDSMIEQGLRGRLNLQSLLTGKLEVELDFHPHTPIRLLNRSKEYPEIPTIPSSMEKLTSALEGLPLERMIKRITDILDALETTLTSTDMPALTNNLSLTVQRLEQITAHLEKTIPRLTENTSSLLAESQETLGGIKERVNPMILAWTGLAEDSRSLINQLEASLHEVVQGLDQSLVSGGAAMQQLERSAASLNSLMREDSLLMHEIQGALQELAAAARSIRLMAEYLERHPEALLRGKQ
jgi:paraquat-inducible protein B